MVLRGNTCLDFVDQFIKSNLEHYRDDHNVEFQIFDLYHDYIVAGYDHIILCGVFNNMMADNDSFMKNTVRKNVCCSEPNNIV